MCELYGFSGKKRKKLNSDLREFFSHSRNHPDGWGMAALDDNDSSFLKESVSAFKSDKLKGILEGEIENKNLIAHIRLATVGYDEYNNTHPFRGRDKSGREWTFVHNGTIFEGDILVPYLYRQKGSTDSERIFLYLIERMNNEIEKKGWALGSEERFQVIQSLVKELAAHNKLNLIIFDGEFMYVHTNCKDSLYLRDDKDGVTFSTVPLKEGRWKHVPPMRAIAYKDGKKFYEGDCHGLEYIPDEKSIRALYLAYAGL